MFTLRPAGPGKDPMMFCLARAGAGPLGVPYTLVPFEDARPPRAPRAAAVPSAAPAFGVKARRPEGESGAPATPSSPAGPGPGAPTPKWR